MQKTFSFTGAKKIVFGCGSFSGLVGQVRDLRAKKPFIAIDGNLAKLGMRDKILEMFEREGMKAVLYDKVLPEPPLEQADEGAKLALKGKCDIVIGIGGGSAMDVAKAVAVVAAHGAGAPWTSPRPWPSWPPTGPRQKTFWVSTRSPARGFRRSWFPRRQAREAR